MLMMDALFGLPQAVGIWRCLNIFSIGADVHVHDDYALISACQNGHLDIVKYLLKQGADIHVRNDLALRQASRKGHLKVVKYLVEQGANIYAEDAAALHKATQNGHSDVVEYLTDVLNHSTCCHV